MLIKKAQKNSKNIPTIHDVVSTGANFSKKKKIYIYIYIYMAFYVPIGCRFARRCGKILQPPSLSAPWIEQLHMLLNLLQL